LLGLVIALNIVLAFLGYVLPVPAVVLAGREWAKLRKVLPTKAWRRTISHIRLLLVSLGVGLWTYAIVREAMRQDYLYEALSARVGRWGSLGLIVVSGFAESKLRRYLLLGAAGLLFFFVSSIGDVAI
jgi:hypothetical protein